MNIPRTRRVCGSMAALIAAAITASAQTPISTAKIDADLDYFPDNDFVPFTVRGIVASPNIATDTPGAGQPFEVYIQDTNDNAGIAIFFDGDLEPTFDTSTITTGMLINAQGRIGATNGNRIIVPNQPSVNITVVNPGPFSPVITGTTITNLLTPVNASNQPNAEVLFEGGLVRVTNCTFASGSWPSRGNNAFTLFIDDGTGELQMFVDRDTNVDGQPQPTEPFDVVGIIKQYDNDGFPDEGYELIPRSYADFTVTNAPVAPALQVAPAGTVFGAVNRPLVFDLFATDANPQDTITFSTAVAPGGSLTFLGDREAVYEWTPGPADADSTNTISFVADDGALAVTSHVEVVVLPVILSDIVLNEFQADPINNLFGDANDDGVTDFREDEFVELYNRNTTNDQDIGNWVLQVGTNELFTLPAGTILTAETAVVVFGGARSTLDPVYFGNAQVFVPLPASPTNDWFGLSNSGGNGPINLLTDAGGTVFTVDYGSEAGNNQSRNLNPELTGTQYADHTTIPDSGGRRYSPGTLVNGGPFNGSGLVNSPPFLQPVADTFVAAGGEKTVGFSATDFDGDTITITVSNAPLTAVLVPSGPGAADLVYTGQVADVGQTFTVTVAAADAALEDTTEFLLVVTDTPYSGLIINEFIPDPNGPDDADVDSNNDGTFNSTDDEFVELVNTTTNVLDMENCAIATASGGSHTFSSVLLQPGGAIVVFGGGTNDNFTASPSQVSSGGLRLSNSGTTVDLFDPSANLLDTVTYGSSPDGASLNRNPDVTGPTFATHSTVPGAGSRVASPGTRVDGGPFLTNQPPTLVVSGFPAVRVGEPMSLDATATEPDGELVSLTITVLPNSVTVTNNGNGVATGQFTFTPDAGQIGTQTVTFIAMDSNGADTNTIEIDVRPAVTNLWDFETQFQGWTIRDEASSKTWVLVRNPGNDSQGTDFYAEMNGFAADTGSDDWLISPALDLTAFTNPTLDFSGQIGPHSGTDTNLTLQVSADYLGTGTVSAATWTEVAIPVAAEQPDWTPTQLALPGVAGSNGVYVAFRYQSSGSFDSQYEWRVDQVTLTDVAGAPPTITPPLTDQMVTVSNLLSFTVDAVELEGDFVTLTASNVPPTASFIVTNGNGAASGQFRWTPDSTETGVVQVGFFASDGDGTDTNIINITVKSLSVGEPWINEFHYDNNLGDVGEFVEIAGPAGIDLSAYELVKYNGNGGGEYGTNALSGVIDNEGDCIGALSFPVVGLQNGDPDGIALVKDGTTVLEFISYEGTFMATNGPAAGMLSENIGVSEPSNTPIGQSVQLVGSGKFLHDFTWSGPAAESPGDLNVGQNIVNGCGGPLDSDGDGATDDEEAIAGTNPNDSNDVFFVKGVLPTGGTIEMTIPTKTNRNYVIQFTDDLTDTNSWQDLAPADVGSGGDDTVTDNTPTNGALYYRGDVRLP